MPRTGIHAMGVEDLIGVYSREDDSDGASKRIRALIAKLKEANDRGDAAEQALETATKTAAKDARKAADEEWSAKMATKDEALELSRLGIQDEDTTLLLRRQYDRLPDATRSAQPFSDFVKAAKEDPKAREGFSPAAQAAVKLAWDGKDGGAPDLTSGTDRDTGTLNEDKIRAAFAQGHEGFEKLLASLPST